MRNSQENTCAGLSFLIKIVAEKFLKIQKKTLNLVFNKVAGLRPFIRSRCLSGQIIAGLVEVEICFSCHFIIWHVKKALKDWEGGGVPRYVFYFKVSTISKAASGRKLGWYRYIWLSFYKVWQFQFVHFFHILLITKSDKTILLKMWRAVIAK